MIDDIAVHSLQYADDSVIMYTTESGLLRFLNNLKFIVKSGCWKLILIKQKS